MKIRVSETTGIQLDWLVAKCEERIFFVYEERVRARSSNGTYDFTYSPSTDWAQAGPIIGREHISVVWVGFQWCATSGDVAEVYRSDEGNYFQGSGPTPLIAAMRCFVASKLGDEVEVPEELT